MALTSEDRDWLQGQFDRVHDRINKADSDIHQVELECVKRIGEHEERRHDLGKSVGTIGGIVALVTGLIEGLKYWFRKE